MQSSSFLFKPGKAIVITKYHSPTIAYEQVCRNTVKCAAIVDTSDGITAPFLTQFVCFNVDPILGKILWHQIRISYNFCVGLTSWLFYQWRKMEKKRAEQLNGGFHHVLDLGRACSVHMQEKKAKNNSGVCKIHTHINIQPLTCLCIEPDLRWCKRLLAGLVEYMQLQDALAWLSTLGGAYSAMGEHLHSYAEKAGQISHHQLLVAMRLGNPVLAAQCKVFAALSLIQRGRLKMASRIIREQYRSAALNGYVKDEKLISSCRAAWYRIQYLRKQQRMNKQALGMLT